MDGLRRSKTVNGAVTNHIWSGGSIIAETGAEGIVTDKYIRGLGLLYSENKSGDKKNYLYNGHGDVVQLVQGSEIVKNYDYTAFGEEIQLNADDDNPFRYCGEYLDLETGFVYLRARYYDPSIGRFTQEDPVKDGLNWYLYCNNNPVKFVDPSGLDCVLVNKPVDNLTNVIGVEHMSAFFQDENNDWWFFFWGDTVKYVKVDDPTIFEDLDSINEWLVKNNLLDPENPYRDSV